MSICARCGAAFTCGMQDDGATGACWCMRLPPLAALPAPSNGNAASNAGCWCPACLEQHIAARQAAASATREGSH